MQAQAHWQSGKLQSQSCNAAWAALGGDSTTNATAAPFKRSAMIVFCVCRVQQVAGYSLVASFRLGS